MVTAGGEAGGAGGVIGSIMIQFGLGKMVVEVGIEPTKAGL